MNEIKELIDSTSALMVEVLWPLIEIPFKKHFEPRYEKLKLEYVSSDSTNESLGTQLDLHSAIDGMIRIWMQSGLRPSKNVALRIQDSKFASYETMTIRKKCLASSRDTESDKYALKHYDPEFNGPIYTIHAYMEAKKPVSVTIAKTEEIIKLLLKNIQEETILQAHNTFHPYIQYIPNTDTAFYCIHRSLIPNALIIDF